MIKRSPLISEASELWLIPLGAWLQVIVGGVVYQTAEGFSIETLTAIAASYAYLVPALIAALLGILAVRKFEKRLSSDVSGSTATTLIFTSMAAANLAAGGLVIGLEGLELLAISLLGASVFGFVLFRFVQNLLGFSTLFTCVFGWVGLAAIVVDVSITYQLLSAISGKLFDPNALLFAALIFLLTLSGVAVSAWFWVREDALRLAPKYVLLVVGGTLLVFWFGMLVWNRVSLVPRLYPEVHGSIAFFELMVLIGALRWLQLGFPPRAPSLKTSGSIALLTTFIAATLLVTPDISPKVPRRVDFTAQFFSKPWVWVFDRDSDGYLPLWLGGGDCDDTNPSANALGREVPTNGIDENCSGGDLGDFVEPQVNIAKVRSDLTVLVSIDMLRPDFMSVYGFDEPTTPVMESLKDEFTRFDNAYASGGITTLSLPSVLRGRIPMAIDFEHVYRTVDLTYVFPDERKPQDRVNRVFLSPRSDSNPTIADVFRNAGRTTYAAIDDGPGSIFRRGFGFEKGFQHVYYPNTPEGPGADAWTSREVTDAVLKIVNEAPEGSFIWVHYYDPHNATPPCRKFSSTRGLGCYKDAIADVDRLLGEVVDEMKRLDRWEQSTMIITSDHGEALGEHGLSHHGLDSYEEFVRIPLLIRSPLTRGLPRTFDVPVSLIDASLSAVVAGGLVPPSTFQGEDLHRVLQGEERRFPVISQLLIMEVNGTPVRQQSLLIQGSQRFMWDRISGRTWLFDLDEDPSQLGDHGDMKARLEAKSKLQELLDVMEAKKPKP